jgi:hypothetical protein
LYINGGTKSGSAKRLAAALTEKLGYKVWRSDKINPKKQALKYGQGVDKISQYEWFKSNEIPSFEFTKDKSVVLGWLADGGTVFGRSLLSSSCGKGIVVMEPGQTEVTPCPVYTLYKKKKREFRVHVFKDKVVRVVEKKLRKDWDGPRDSKIRNLANGYVFCGCDSPPDGITALALSASKVVSSDFAGVDIGYNEKENQLFVIEVNSAPGIEGSNVDAYVEAICD